MALQSFSIPTSLISLRHNLYDLFEDKTSDESGEIDLTLTRIPTDINHIVVNCLTSGFIATATGLTDATLTITIRKLRYEKADVISGDLTNLPTGVTEQSTKQTPTSSSRGGVGSDSAGGGNQSLWTETHNHTIDLPFMYRHNHPVSTTETDMILATSQEGLNFLILYE